jgi:predicted MFS family arabinose efflux permease
MNRPGRWSILAVLALARIAMGFQFQSIASLSPQLIEAFEADYAAIGTLVGLYLMPGIVVALPGGFLGARFGEKRLSLLGLGLMTLGGLLAAIGDSYALAVVARVLAGTGVVLQFVLMTKMLTDWFADRELFLAMGLYLNGWPVGIALGLVAQAPLAEATSWQAVMLTTAILSLAALALVALFYRSPADAPASGATGARPSRLAGAEIVLVSLAGLVWGLLNMGYVVIVSFAPGFLAARGTPFAEATATVSLATWLAVIAVPAGGFLVSRLGRPNLFMVFCTLVGGATIALLPYTDAAVPLFTVMGLIMFAQSGIVTTLPIEAVRPGNRTAGLGVFYTWWYLALALAPPLAGLALDRTGDAEVPMLLAAAFTFAALPVLALFRVLQARWRRA